MDRLRILPHSYVRELRGALDSADRVREYREHGGPDIDASRLLPTPLSAPPAVPAWSGGEDGALSAHDDAENAVLAYEWLGDLSPTQASDTRLWTTLTHIQCREYVRRRWAPPAEPERAKGLVDRHWFTAASGRARLRVNGVSRLWWAAHLTHAPWRSTPALADFETADPYRFTRILFRSQQVNFDVVERKFGSSVVLRTCLLDALDEGFALVNSPDQLSKEVSKEVNLLVRTRQIDSLCVSTQRELLGEIVTRCARRIT